MQFRRTSHHGSRADVIGRLALPVGETSTGPFQDGHQRQEVPRVHDRIDHHIHPPRAQQQVAVTVSEAPVEPNRAAQGIEPGSILVLGWIKGIGRQEGSLGKAGAGSDPDRSIIESGGDSISNHQLTRHGLVNASHNGPTAMEQTDESPKEGDSQDETFGPVHRIEHPDVLGVAPFSAKFFADNAMLWKATRNHLPHHLLGSAISEGHGRGIALKFQAHVPGSEVRQDNLGAGLGEFPHKGNKGLVIH